MSVTAHRTFSGSSRHLPARCWAPERCVCSPSPCPPSSPSPPASPGSPSRLTTTASTSRAQQHEYRVFKLPPMISASQKVPGVCHGAYPHGRARCRQRPRRPWSKERPPPYPLPKQAMCKGKRRPTHGRISYVVSPSLPTRYVSPYLRRSNVALNPARTRRQPSRSESEPTPGHWLALASKTQQHPYTISHWRVNHCSSSGAPRHCTKTVRRGPYTPPRVAMASSLRVTDRTAGRKAV